MSFDWETLAALEYRDIQELLASSGARITGVHRSGGAARWRVVITHTHGSGRSAAYGDTVLDAVLEAMIATDKAGGLNADGAAS